LAVGAPTKRKLGKSLFTVIHDEKKKRPKSGRKKKQMRRKREKREKGEVVVGR